MSSLDAFDIMLASGFVGTLILFLYVWFGAGD